MDFVTVKTTLSKYDTDELQRIWIEHDQETWTSIAFRAVAEILKERGLELPPIGGRAAEQIRGERLVGQQKKAAEVRTKLGRTTCHVIAFLGALPTALVGGLLLAGLSYVLPLPSKWQVEFAAFGTISTFLFAWSFYFRLLARRFLG